MAADLISGVPNEITVGFIGILGVAVGAVGTGLGTWWATRAQLKHDREQREAERIFTIKRDVFLDYAEAATRPLVYLSKITNSEITMNELTTLQQSTMGPATKMHGVAELGTVKKLLEAEESFVGSLLSLLPRRIQLEKLNYQIGAASAHMEHIERQAAQFSESIHSLSRMPNPDMGRIDDATNLLRREHTKSAELMEHRAQLVVQRSKLQLGMAADAATMQAEYARCLAKLNVAMREELKLPISNGYEQAVMDSQARVQVKQAAFSAHLRKELEALEKSTELPGSPQSAPAADPNT